MNNSIYLRRKQKIFIQPKNDKLNKRVLATMLKNIETLGYTFSKEILEILNTFDEDSAEVLYNNIIKNLKEMIGAHRQFNPMYPNFPKQVMEASDAELYINAMMHYLGDWIGYRIMPNYEKEKRPELKDKFKLKVIELGSLEDFESIFKQLLSANTSISETDKDDVKWFIESYKSRIMTITPEVIPLKENVALFAGLLMKINPKETKNIISKYIKTATDVLRLATQFSDGDISLAENTKFKNFKRFERKLILGLLENCKNHTDDMMRYKDRWIRLGEKLHPGEYKIQFPNVYKSFDIIRNNKPYQTYNSKIEEAIKEKEILTAVNLLKLRPGDFARKLDNLIRKSWANENNVVNGFKEVAKNVSSNVLIQVMNHFQNRNEETKNDFRVFFPKGNVSKVKSIDNKLTPINANICNEIIEICKNNLIEKYSKLPELGNCYLDENLKNYTVPFALRSASKALRTIARGSKLDIPSSANTIRFFIWWKQLESERVDIDLSALALNKNFEEITTLSYYSLRGGEYASHNLGCHSGDITSAPKGASEFIDINIKNAINTNIRYIVMSINSFTEQPYKDLPECFAGYMTRRSSGSGEIYDPRTVQNKFDLTSDTKMSLPLIIDLEKRKVVWTDISIKPNRGFYNNVRGNLNSLQTIAKSMVIMKKPNLYDLFQLHIKARGTIVENKKDAKTIFSVDEGITPTDISKIISEFI